MGGAHCTAGRGGRRRHVGALPAAEIITECYERAKTFRRRDRRAGTSAEEESVPSLFSGELRGLCCRVPACPIDAAPAGAGSACQPFPTITHGIFKTFPRVAGVA